MGLLLTSTLQSDTGMASDAVVNTFALGGPAVVTDADADAMVAAIATFWSVLPPGNATKVCHYLSPVLSQAAGAAQLDIYNITGKLFGEPHGSPVKSRNFTLGESQNVTALPSEVAVCMTLETAGRANAPVEQADGADAGFARDRPKQRNTGRLYIGPLGPNAVVLDAGVARPAPSFLATLRTAGKKLAEDLALASPGGPAWGVWSRKDGVIRPISFISTDNAFDTQRRRGEDPTFRDRLATGII
jgi:hypothetical protein